MISPKARRLDPNFYFDSRGWQAQHFHGAAAALGYEAGLEIRCNVSLESESIAVRLATRAAHFARMAHAELTDPEEGKQ